MANGRFAPSPSGPLHLGNLRTAMLAWLFARSSNGRFAMRMEDLTTGAAPVAEAEQLGDLAEIGLTWDGPITSVRARRALPVGPDAIGGRGPHLPVFLFAP